MPARPRIPFWILVLPLTLTQVGCGTSGSLNLSWTVFWQTTAPAAPMPLGPAEPASRTAPAAPPASGPAAPTSSTTATTPPARDPTAIAAGPAAPTVTTTETDPGIMTVPAQGTVDADLAPTSQPSISQAAVFFPPTTARVGAAFDRAGILTTQAPLQRLTFEITYDPAGLEYLEFVPANALPAGSVVLTSAARGRLTFEVRGRGQRETNTPIGKVRFNCTAITGRPDNGFSLRVTSVQFQPAAPA